MTALYVVLAAVGLVFLGVVLMARREARRPIELPPLMPGFGAMPRSPVAGLDDAIAEAAFRRRAAGGQARADTIKAEVQAARRQGANA